MRAVLIETFSERPKLVEVPDPRPVDDGVVVEVKATGVCRSDWHAWVGHDEGVVLPHVPGHELAGVIVEVGKEVKHWKPGDRVTVPFVSGCGDCPQCRDGQQQVCDHQSQPGFTHWGSFAEYVSLHHADLNLVRLPEWLDFATAASLGCRFVTSFRALVDQARTQAGQWVAVHGCGGVGLSAIMIASALGAKVVAVDLTAEKLKLAKELGASVTIDATSVGNIPEAVKDATGGGAHVSVDALGHSQTCLNSIAGLRKRGKHIQIGLMFGEHRAPQIPMDRVVAEELEILGSHGIQAHRYDVILDLIKSGKLQPDRLVGRTISLGESIEALVTMNEFPGIGATVVTDFGK